MANQSDRLYDMGLGETQDMNFYDYQSYSVTRVPGGWLFTRVYKASGSGKVEQMTTTFVPFNNEFQDG